MAASQRFPSRRILAIAGAILVAAMSCRSNPQLGVDVRQRSRELTRHLYAGVLDSLPGSALLDLGGPGDTGLVRWFVDHRRDSLGHEWPTDPLLTLEGPQAGPTFLVSFAENVPGEAPAGYRGPGNVVAIDHGGSEFSVLANLRRGSVRVATGQKIEAGETVGECGNNGESALPHLHYQLQLDPRPGRPVPAPFSNFMAEGVRVAPGQPTRGQRVIHAARP